jgi:hypothetical protein
MKQKLKNMIILSSRGDNWLFGEGEKIIDFTRIQLSLIKSFPLIFNFTMEPGSGRIWVNV